MTMHATVPTTDKSTLSDRYVHAATRTLPDDERTDVADELRSSIADRVDSLQAEHPDLTRHEAEYAAVLELGDPDRMTAAYAGTRPQLIGPYLYPHYEAVLKKMLLTAVLPATLLIAIINTVSSKPVGAAIGHTVWMGITIALHITFWTTLAFALIERAGPADKEKSQRDSWNPDQLPDVPAGPNRVMREVMSNLVWLAIIGLAIIWQHYRSPLQTKTNHLPILDPRLWPFWLPLILAILAAKMGFEGFKYRKGKWSSALATTNTALGLTFIAPIVYLAAANRLLNPAAVALAHTTRPGFNVHAANTITITIAILTWLWDSINGWRQVAPTPKR
jgi:hypothetical protein